MKPQLKAGLKRRIRVMGTKETLRLQLQQLIDNLSNEEKKALSK